MRYEELGSVPAFGARMRSLSQGCCNVIVLSESSPVLVFGGPYSNLQATEALVGVAARRGIPPGNVICTGDVVAYCAEPEETSAAIRAWGCHTIQGNCEESLATGAADCGCNFEEGTTCDLLSKGWYPFADARISAETRAWMGALPRSLAFNYCGLTFRVIHGGVAETAHWVFASDPATLAVEAGAAGSDVVIAGHCGLPFIARTGGRTWFNAGVIGMPANDGSADVWFGLIEPLKERQGVRLSLHRLAYDHMRAAAALRRMRFADGYARTLIDGLWPSMDVLPETERQQRGVKLRQKSAIVHASSARGVHAAAE